MRTLLIDTDNKVKGTLRRTLSGRLAFGVVVVIPAFILLKVCISAGYSYGASTQLFN